MTIEFGFTDELVNTQYALLAVLCAHYQQNHLLKPFEKVQIPVKIRGFSPMDKLIQTMVSILAGQLRAFVRGQYSPPLQARSGSNLGLAPLC